MFGWAGAVMWLGRGLMLGNHLFRAGIWASWLAFGPNGLDYGMETGI